MPRDNQRYHTPSSRVDDVLEQVPAVNRRQLKERMKTLQIEHEGRVHRITVNNTPKRRIMRVYHPEEETSLTTGLAPYEDWQAAAKHVIRNNPGLAR